MQHKAQKKYYKTVLQLITGLILSISIALPDVSAQDDPTQRLKELENILAAKRRQKETLEKAASGAKTDAERVSRNLAVAANDIQLAEGNVSRLEVRIGSLEQEVTKKQEILSDRQDELLTLMSALERLSKRPAALALLQPSEALDTARSASLMGTIVPQINAKAKSLKTDLANLAIIQAKLSRERFSLKNTLERLTQHQLKLASLLRKRKAEASEASTAAKKTAQDIDEYVKEAKSLRDLMNKLAKRAEAQILAEKRAPAQQPQDDLFRPNGPPISKMKGLLPLPVVGRIIEHFGDKLAVGSAQGMRITTRGGAQVVSPYDGQVVFAGPFRDYGSLLIIEHSGGYHSLLAGLGELYNAVGQWVLAGEPIGLMKVSGKTQNLYLELRKKGRAINPEPWLKRQLAAKTVN